MPDYLLIHRHQPTECGASFAAWRGIDSPLRGKQTHGSCEAGGHTIWWEVEAGEPSAALAMLPEFIAERTEIVESRNVSIP